MPRTFNLWSFRGTASWPVRLSELKTRNSSIRLSGPWRKMMQRILRFSSAIYITTEVAFMTSWVTRLVSHRRSRLSRAWDVACLGQGKL